MKKKSLHQSLILAVLLLAVLIPSKVRAAEKYEWVFDREHARVQYVNVETREPLKSTFKKIGKKTYYFNKKGYASTGFQKIDGFYYFFDSNGVMLKSEWRAGRFFKKNGCMAVNEFVRDESGQKVYVGKDGQIIENFKKSRKAKFIKTPKGTRYRNLDGTYSRHTWQCINKRWYYFYSSGYLARSKKLGKFYVDRNGRMVTNKWVRVDHYRYYFGADGRQTKKVRIKHPSSHSPSGDDIVTIG